MATFLEEIIRAVSPSWFCKEDEFFTVLLVVYTFLAIECCLLKRFCEKSSSLLVIAAESSRFPRHGCFLVLEVIITLKLICTCSLRRQLSNDLCTEVRNFA
jgi:hypothetical protein